MNDVDKGNIRDFIEHTSEVLDSFSESDMDEQTTRQYLISNFLGDILGWPVSRLKGNYKVKSEYAIQMASRTKNVDYALLNENNDAICIVESKRVSKSLSKKQKKQLKSYMKSEELIWGILSNGKEYCFYIRDDKDTIKEIEISHTTYSNLESIVDLISLYSYSSLINDESLERRKEILKQHRRVKDFNIEEEKNSLYDLLNPQKESEKNLIDEFINEYKNLLKSRDNMFQNSVDNNRKVRIEEDSDKIKNKIEKETPVKFKNNKIKFDDSITAREHVLSVINLLFRLNYLSEGDVPLTRGSKRYLINTEPVDSEGDDMYGPKELSNGYYVETNYSTEDCKKIISELIEEY